MIEKYKHLFSFNSELNEKLAGKPFYEYVKPVTFEELNLFEKKYDIMLPKDFKLFYSETNGLSTRRGFSVAFPFKDSSSNETYFELEGLDPISMNGSLSTLIDPNYYPEMEPYPESEHEERKISEKIKNYLTLTHNSQGTYLLMGIGSLNCGHMYIWDHHYYVFEGDVEYPLKIAESFTEFLDGIVPLSSLDI